MKIDATFTRDEVLNELSKLLMAVGDDIYQKYADTHNMTRRQAKLFLFPILYGGLFYVRPDASSQVTPQNPE